MAEDKEIEPQYDLNAKWDAAFVNSLTHPPLVLMPVFFSSYYLEKNIEARENALEREADLEDKSSKAKAKS